MSTSASSPRAARRAIQTPRWLPIAAVIGLAGCAVGPNFRPPSSPRSAVLDAAAPSPQAPPAPVASDWWTAFGSQDLNRLVARGLSANSSLRAAGAALDQARSLARAGAGVFAPSLDVSLSQDRERSSPIRVGSAGQPTTFTLNTASVSLAYVFDLFGAERRTVEGLRAAAESAAQAEKGARIILAANLLDTAMRAAADRDIVRDYSRIEALDAVVLAAAEALRTAGHGDESAVLDAERQLQADRASGLNAQQSAFAELAALKTLCGLEPGEAAPPLPALRAIRTPDPPPAAVPARLVRRRPDVLQAEADLHAATASEGVAVAALFPSISLSGDYGAASFALSRLAAPAGRFWSVGPGVDWPIFSGGARWQGAQAAKAARLKAAANYRQTVLSALEQTADVLRASETDAGTLAAQARAAADAERQANLARTDARAGLISEAQAAGAEIAAARADIVLISALAARLQDSVALYAALGGGVNEGAGP